MKYLAVLSVYCLLTATAVGISGPAVGEAVAHSEVDDLMGQCADYGPYSWLCYGGNCMAGGCGCVYTRRLDPGIYQINAAVPCATSWYCTTPQSVDYFKLCGY